MQPANPAPETQPLSWNEFSPPPIRIAREFVDGYRENHPGDQVDLLDLWNTRLRRFDGDVIAKYRILHGELG